MERTDITIIGAGVIGLAVSAAVSRQDRCVYVLEKNDSFGRESSSRNSEVVHAGIYYPKDSLKAKTCTEGSRLIYEICKENNIGCKRLGKLIVVCAEEEVKALQRLLHQGLENTVSDLKIFGKKEIRNLEPGVKAQAALYSPNTGIVDSHGLMYYFLQKAKAQGAEFAFKTCVRQILPRKAGYEVNVGEADGSSFSFFSRLVINCAGLESDIIAESAGIDIKAAGYLLKFCKGEYFRVRGEKSRLIKHLVYPLPETGGISLGIHATPDLGGGLRLGPDAEYIEKDQANYNINEAKKEEFAHRVRRFLPFIDAVDLSADTAGIRPKLQGAENGFRDFAINHEAQRGLPGLINLIGIDSPGLTAAPAIARRVSNIVEEIL